MLDPETAVGKIVWDCGSTHADPKAAHEVNVELCIACFKAAVDAARVEGFLECRKRADELGVRSGMVAVAAIRGLRPAQDTPKGPYLSAPVCVTQPAPEPAKPCEECDGAGETYDCLCGRCGTPCPKCSVKP